MIRPRPIASFALVLALAACGDNTTPANTAIGNSAALAPDPAADRAAIERAEQEMRNGFAERDIDRIVARYAPDAHVVSGIESLQGRAAMRRSLAEQFKDDSLEHSWRQQRLQVSGDLGYVAGRFESAGVDPSSGRRVRVEGNYVTVYRRQPDGSWQAIDDINVPDKLTPA